MSVRRLAEIQPESFVFTPENKAWAEKQIAKYPAGRQASAVISLLWRAQAQHDYWVPKAAIEEVARMLGMPYIRVLEIATFYTMFNLAPVGKYFIQMCGTTPCVLAGSDAIKSILQKRIGEQRHVTKDGLFSWLEVECLGACCNAPMVQINDDYYEDLSLENFELLLDNLAAGKPVHIGSQTGRKTSEPAGGLTSLLSLYGVDGRSGPDSGEHVPAGARAPRSGAMRDDVTANQKPTPAVPGMGRSAQEHEHSAAKPEKTEDTGTSHTAPSSEDEKG
jgi:NADH-quinone oxidoreductase subunit E